MPRVDISYVIHKCYQEKTNSHSYLYALRSYTSIVQLQTQKLTCVATIGDIYVCVLVRSVHAVNLTNVLVSSFTGVR